MARTIHNNHDLVDNATATEPIVSLSFIKGLSTPTADDGTLVPLASMPTAGVNAGDVWNESGYVMMGSVPGAAYAAMEIEAVTSGLFLVFKMRRNTGWATFMEWDAVASVWREFAIVSPNIEKCNLFRRTEAESAGLGRVWLSKFLPSPTNKYDAGVIPDSTFSGVPDNDNEYINYIVQIDFELEDVSRKIRICDKSATFPPAGVEWMGGIELLRLQVIDGVSPSISIKPHHEVRRLSSYGRGVPTPGYAALRSMAGPQVISSWLHAVRCRNGKAWVLNSHVGERLTGFDVATGALVAEFDVESALRLSAQIPKGIDGYETLINGFDFDSSGNLYLCVRYPRLSDFQLYRTGTLSPTYHTVIMKFDSSFAFVEEWALGALATDSPWLYVLDGFMYIKTAPTAFRKYSLGGSLLKEVTAQGLVGTNDLKYLARVGGYFYAAESVHSRIVKMTDDGVVLGQFGDLGNPEVGALLYLTGMDVDSSGRVAATDHGGVQVWKSGGLVELGGETSADEVEFVLGQDQGSFAARTHYTAGGACAYDSNDELWAVGRSWHNENDHLLRHFRDATLMKSLRDGLTEVAHSNYGTLRVSIGDYSPVTVEELGRMETVTALAKGGTGELWVANHHSRMLHKIDYSNRSDLHQVDRVDDQALTRTTDTSWELPSAAVPETVRLTIDGVLQVNGASNLGGSIQKFTVSGTTVSLLNGLTAIAGSTVLATYIPAAGVGAVDADAGVFCNDPSGALCSGMVVSGSTAYRVLPEKEVTPWSEISGFAAVATTPERSVYCGGKHFIMAWLPDASARTLVQLSGTTFSTVDTSLIQSGGTMQAGLATDGTNVYLVSAFPRKLYSMNPSTLAFSEVGVATTMASLLNNDPYGYYFGYAQHGGVNYLIGSLGAVNLDVPATSYLYTSASSPFHALDDTYWGITAGSEKMLGENMLGFENRLYGPGGAAVQPTSTFFPNGFVERDLTTLTLKRVGGRINPLPTLPNPVLHGHSGKLYSNIADIAQGLTRWDTASGALERGIRMPEYRQSAMYDRSGQASLYMVGSISYIVFADDTYVYAVSNDGAWRATHAQAGWATGWSRTPTFAGALEELNLSTGASTVTHLAETGYKTGLVLNGTELVILDIQGRRLLRYDATTKAYIGAVTHADLTAGACYTITKDATTLCVACKNKLVKFALANYSYTATVANTDGVLDEVKSIQVDTAGNIWVASWNVAWKLNSSGVVQGYIDENDGYDYSECPLLTTLLLASSDLFLGFQSDSPLVNQNTSSPGRGYVRLVSLT